MHRSLWSATLALTILGAALAGCDGVEPELASRSSAVIGGAWCNSAADCPLGKVCLLNHCVTDLPSFCTNDSQCDRGEVCIAKRCQPGDGNPGSCTTDASCGSSWLRCLNGSCQLKPGRCTNGVGCACGEVCDANHYCVPGQNYCTLDSQCGPGESCHTTCCKPKFCTSNSDCPWSDYFCRFSAGTCGGTSTCRAKPANCASIDTHGYASRPYGYPTVQLGCDNLHYKTEEAAHCNEISILREVTCHMCTMGTEYCSGDAVMGCRTTAEGCRQVYTKERCDADEYCTNAVCQPCNNTCAYVGQKVCDGDNLKTCEENTNGCLRLKTSKFCPYECKGGACTSSPQIYYQTATFMRSGSGYQSASLGDGVCVARSRTARTKSFKNPNYLPVYLGIHPLSYYLGPQGSLSFTTGDNLLTATTYGIYPEDCFYTGGADACPTTLSINVGYWCKRL